MGGDPFRPFKSNDSFPQQVAWWNAVNGLIKRGHANRPMFGAQATSFAWGRSVLVIQNNTGSDLAVGDVVGTGNSLYASTDGGFARSLGPTFASSGVSGTSDVEAWGIAVEPIADDSYGHIAVSGMAITQIVISDNTHEYATPASGTTLMSSRPRGPARIVWKEGSSGTVWAIVRFRAPEEILWAIVTDVGWTDNRPGGLPTVEAYVAENAANANGQEDVFLDINMYIPDGKEPAYYEDDMVAYILDAMTGDPYAISPLFDDPIGTPKPWHDITNIPKGWQLADGTNGTRNLRGVFIASAAEGGLTAGEETAGIGPEGEMTEEQTGGHYLHGHPLGQDDEAALGGPEAVGDPSGDVDGRPPYFAIAWIERTS